MALADAAGVQTEAIVRNGVLCCRSVCVVMFFYFEQISPTEGTPQRHSNGNRILRVSCGNRYRPEELMLGRVYRTEITGFVFSGRRGWNIELKE